MKQEIVKKTTIQKDNPKGNLSCWLGCLRNEIKQQN